MQSRGWNVAVLCRLGSARARLWLQGSTEGVKALACGRSRPGSGAGCAGRRAAQRSCAWPATWASRRASSAWRLGFDRSRPAPRLWASCGARGRATRRPTASRCSPSQPRPAASWSCCWPAVHTRSPCWAPGSAMRSTAARSRCFSTSSCAHPAASPPSAVLGFLGHSKVGAWLHVRTHCAASAIRASSFLAPGPEDRTPALNAGRPRRRTSYCMWTRWTPRSYPATATCWSSSRHSRLTSSSRPTTLTGAPRARSPARALPVLARCLHTVRSTSMPSGAGAWTRSRGS